jgi:hypothetical protein
MLIRVGEGSERVIGQGLLHESGFVNSDPGQLRFSPVRYPPI